MMSPDDPVFQAALEQCAREPVHTPGSIQSCGCLISLDSDFTHVVQVSANIGEHMGIDATDALTQTPERILGTPLFRRLRHDLKDRDRVPFALRTTRRVDNQLRAYHVYAYRSGKRVVVEIEQAGQENPSHSLSEVSQWLSRFAGAQSIDALLDILVEGVRTLTGYDRVMVYSFDKDWHGTVIAESRVAEAHSFLGHRFPASDIPPQVRSLYAINPVRIIPDATLAGVPLVPAEDADNGPLDLSPGILRAVSPVHLSYLHNMGVQASLSIAMHGKEGLWGLIAGHSWYPRPLSPAARDAARVLVQAATHRLCLLLVLDDATFLQRVRDNRGLLAGHQGKLRTPEDIMRDHGENWLALFDACGCALIYRDRMLSVGRVPDRGRLESIAGWLHDEHRGAGIWQTSQLAGTGLAGQVAPQEACGLMAARLPLSAFAEGWLLLFRAEQIETYRWAGKLEKVLVGNDGNARLSPRHSFESWMQEVNGQSKAWTRLEQQAAVDLAEDLAVSVSGDEITQLNAQLKRDREALAEANERLKHLAHTDPLTQLWNRYRTETAIEAELRAANRYGRPFSLLLYDIDHFKSVNDTHGHEAGDRVLVEVSRVVGQCIRDTDHLGRWGGEEFIVLATHSRLEDAGKLAERLRQAIAAIDLAEIGRVTVSIGVAAWRRGDTANVLVDRADRAMYRAKEGGRNRIVLEDASAPAP